MAKQSHTNHTWVVQWALQNPLQMVVRGSILTSSFGLLTKVLELKAKEEGCKIGESTHVQRNQHDGCSNFMVGQVKCKVVTAPSANKVTTFGRQKFKFVLQKETFAVLGPLSIPREIIHHFKSLSTVSIFSAYS